MRRARRRESRRGPERAQASANVPAPDPPATCDSNSCHATPQSEARGSVNPVTATAATAANASAAAIASLGKRRARARVSDPRGCGRRAGRAHDRRPRRRARRRARGASRSHRRGATSPRRSPRPRRTGATTAAVRMNGAASSAHRTTTARPAASATTAPRLCVSGRAAASTGTVAARAARAHGSRVAGGEPDAEDDADRRECGECVRVAERLREQRPLERVDGACLGEVARERVDDDRDDRRVRQDEQVLRRAAPYEHDQREHYGRVHGGAPQLEDGLRSPVGPQPRHADPCEQCARRREPRPRGSREVEFARRHRRRRGCPRRERAGPNPRRWIEAALVERERDDECRRHEQQRVHASHDVHHSPSSRRRRTASSVSFVWRCRRRSRSPPWQARAGGRRGRPRSRNRCARGASSARCGSTCASRAREPHVRPRRRRPTCTLGSRAPASDRRVECDGTSAELAFASVRR